MTELAAFLAEKNHSHRFEPFTDGLEKCSCGALRQVPAAEDGHVD